MGVGWRPSAWQGWLVFAALVVVAVGAVVALKSSTVRLVVIVGAGAAYALVAALTSGAQAEAREPDDPAPAVSEQSADRPRPRASPRMFDRERLVLGKPTKHGRAAAEGTR